jgi:hypothetical protein
MYSRSKSIALVLIASIAVFSIVSLKLLSPPAVVPSSQGDEEFSAERALIFLSVIAREPHSSGTAAHAQVRDYIYTYCQRMGLETELMDQTGMNVYSNSVRAGRTQNILARLKGTQSGKTILVMSHYDSQPNTPGATDDGAGVAAMMEAIRLLKNSQPLKNDVLFLFTDLEESGLFGAESFVSHYKNLEEIGLIVNFEARGNSGVSFTFEVSKQNGWMMREFSKAVKHSFANSFAYEIYKVMPNDTDFSDFRNTGITGFNTAFIDGYSYYHSMADRIENMDVRSLQHHGDILMQSLQHFGSISLENTKGEDMIFFNPIGSVLWLYPLSWDLPLMILAFVLWIALVVIGYKKGRIKVGSLFSGLGLFFGFLVMSFLLVWGLMKIIIWIYPHYTNFYSFNFYNATDYFWVIAGAVMFCFILLFKKISAKDSHESVLIGSVFALLLIMVAIKITLNTGAYLLYYPLLVLMVVQLVLFLRNVTRESHPILYGLAQLIFIAPAIFLWMPMAYVIFIAFSLVLPFGSVVLFSFCAPFLLSTLGLARSIGKNSVFILPAVLMFFGFFMGHRHSGYDKRHPLQSELMYAADIDSNTAFWISMQRKLDEWNGKYFSSSEKEKFDEFYPGSENIFWKSKAPFQEMPRGKVEILVDSLKDNKRFLRLRAFSDSASHGMRLYFLSKVDLVSLNERLVLKDDKSQIQFVQFMAPSSKGITLELTTEATKPFEVRVIEQRMGLPAAAMVAPLPESFIYAPNYFSNSTHIKYQVKL